MVVWVEAALLENFILDGVLLYLALKAVRVRVFPGRLLLAAIAGAGEAVLFPMLHLQVWAEICVKILGGVLLVVLAVGERRLKPYFIAGTAFFLLTAALGGMLIALYAFTGTEYAAEGYLVERAPIGLLLGGTAAFALFVRLLAGKWYRYIQRKKEIFACTLTAGEREVHWQGLADSGNLLSFRGEPVCVTSAAAIFALFGRDARAAGHIEVNTVNGGRISPVFTCDKLCITRGREKVERRRVFLTVGDVQGDYQLILSAKLMEV